MMKILQTANYLSASANSCDANGLWISLTQYTEESLQACSLHAHENPHITLLIQRGKPEKRQHKDGGRMAGDIVLFHAGEPHQMLLPSKNINLEFENNFFARYDLSEADLEKAVGKNSDAKFLLLKAYKEMLAKDNFSADSITMTTLSLIRGISGAEKKPMYPDWIIKIYELLHDRWKEQVTLQELSLAANVHPTTISKYFPRYFSCTLGEYMRKLKVEKALTLIKSSSCDLTDIALTCGFADQSHFIRTFKQITGFLPSHYQKL